jgi:acyl-coenzyme A thioesterase 13
MSADGAGDAPTVGPVLLTEGRFAGWSTWSAGGDPYETAIGPFCFRVDGARVRCAFEPRREHLNGGGTIHGGALMSFADFALFCIAHKELAGEKAVTLTCNSEFLKAGALHDVVEAEGEVLRATRTMIFVRGLVTQTSHPLLAFSGTLKKIETRSQS